MNIFGKFKGHLSTVCRHKYYVGKNCFKAGLYWRGIKHDLSKFSPTEFIESVKWYQGDRSPIDACKEATGISKAWLHHKGRNSHHYEYFVDYLDQGGKPQQMPFADALEAMCDYLGAGMAYSQNKGVPFSYDAEWDWWKNKKASNPKMHPQTATFFELMFIIMRNEQSNDVIRKSRARTVYKTATKKAKTHPVKLGE